MGIYLKKFSAHTDYEAAKSSLILPNVSICSDVLDEVHYNPYVGISSVTLNKSELSLNKGETETLVATVLPANASNKGVTWSSSDDSVATVSSNGLVTAIGGGNTNITVTTVDGGFTAQCSLNIIVNVAGVTLNKSTLSLSKGATETLVATVSPSDAGNKNVIWSSSNDSVATVNSNGLVTAIGDSGSAIITVTTVDGGFTAQCGCSVIDTNGHDYVEIGGLKWATKNVGASKITDNGLYFQWGDTQGYTVDQVGSGSGKKAFDWPDYKYISGVGTSSSAFTKYNSTDGLTTLEAVDDAASVNMGGSWRMPTSEELQALGAASDFITSGGTKITTSDKLTTLNGVKGILVADKNDYSKRLFFPTAGYCANTTVNDRGSKGFCRTSSLYSGDVSKAYTLLLFSYGVYWGSGGPRSNGYPVRGVIA